MTERHCCRCFCSASRLKRLLLEDKHAFPKGSLHKECNVSPCNSLAAALDGASFRTVSGPAKKVVKASMDFKIAVLPVPPAPTIAKANCCRRKGSPVSSSSVLFSRQCERMCSCSHAAFHKKALAWKIFCAHLFEIWKKWETKSKEYYWSGSENPARRPARASRSSRPAKLIVWEAKYFSKKCEKSKKS